MRLLFWNTNKNSNINPYLISLIQDYSADMLALAEYEDNDMNLCELMNLNRINMIKCSTVGCDRISLWSNYTTIQPAVQGRYYSIHIIDERYILCVVHLMSELYGSREEDRLEMSGIIMHDIYEIANKINSSQIAIVGDFNEMPYGRSCLSANGFHGLPNLDPDERNYRTVNGIEYRKFYNPMWNLFGNFSYPPGTYYYNKSTLHAPMWYIFDQIIISKELMPFFKSEELKIITECNEGCLADKQLHPNKDISDHFPIICELSIVEERNE